jgi:hypothetical protein
MGYLYKTNHDFFKVIDTEVKAYLLGLIFADGTVTTKKGNRQSQIVISLQEEDGYILELFKNIVEKNIIISNPPAVQKRNFKKRAIISATSDILAQDLYNLGCKPNKTFVGINFPDIPEEMKRHFIRGFLDGNGSIVHKIVTYKYKRKKSFILQNPAKSESHKLKIAFSSTDKIFLLRIAEIMNCRPYIREKEKNIKTYTMWLERKDEVEKAINFLYKDTDIFLKRKYAKIMSYYKAIKSQAKSTLLEGLETT